MKPSILYTARLSFPLATALAALLAVQSASAQNGTWTQTTIGPFDWDDIANWSSGAGPIADGVDSTASFIADITAAQTVNLNNAKTIGNITFTDTTLSSHDLIISGANTLTLDVASGLPSINVTQSGRTLTISSVIAGADGLQKTGAGALTLNGSTVNSFIGGLNVSGGTLTLDSTNLGTPINLVDASNALQLNGGTLTITGNATTDTVQTVNGSNLGAGINSIRIAKGAAAGSATLNLGALATTAGSVTTIFPGTTWATGVPSTTEKVFITDFNSTGLPAGATKVNVNASLFYRQSSAAGTARWVNVDSAGQLQAIPAGIANIVAGTNDPTLAFGLSGTVTLTADTTPSIYGLVPNSTSPSTLTTPNNGSLTLNGIIQLNTGASTINAGTGTSNLVIGPERNLVLNMDNTGALNINAPIVNNGGGASSVTIGATIPSGTPGTVTFGGANTYTGATSITRGVLSLNNLAALGGNTPGTNGTSGVSMSTGTTMRATTNGTTVSAPITTAGDVTIGAPTTALGTQAFNEFILNGAIGGSGNVTLNNTNNVNQIFTVTLGAASNYSGTTLIQNTAGNNGQITVKLGAANALPATTVVTLDGNVGSGSGRQAEINLFGFNQEIAGLTIVPRTARLQRVVNSDASAAATLTIGGANNSTFNGFLGGGANFSVSATSIPGSTNGNNFGLTKSGTGTFTLSPTTLTASSSTYSGNTFTGPTKITGGILVLGTSNAILNSPLDTANSITGDANNGLRTTVTTQTIGGLTGNKNLASVFTTTTGGYDGLTALTLNPISGATHSYAGGIVNGATGMNLIKTGTGTQIFTGTNSYTGTTTGSAGVLLATQAAALPGYNSPGKVIFNGGTIAVRVGGGAWTASEVEALVTNATKTSGALGIDTTTGSLIQSAAFTTATFGSTLGLNKLGDNDLTLDQPTTFTGPTTVTAGTLTLTHALALQNSTLVIPSGSIVLSGITEPTFGGLSGSGTFTVTGMTNLTLNPPAGTQVTYSGIIADSTSGMTVTKTGLGVQALTGANLYTGATQINGGILTFGNKVSKTAATATAAAAGSIGLGVHPSDSANYYLAADVALLFNDNNLTGFVLNTGSGVAIDTTNAGGSFNQTVALTAARPLSKTGTGTLVLSQANTYNGTTTVFSGVLSLANANALQNTSGITIGSATPATLSTDVTGITFTVPITTANTGVNSTIAFGRSTAAAGTLTLNGAIGGLGNVIFTTPFLDSANFTQSIDLGAAGTYAGSTTITTQTSNNTIRVRNTSDAANALPAATVLTLDGGDGPSGNFVRTASYDLNGQNQTLAGLTNIARTKRGQRITNGGVGLATLTINNSTDYTFGGSGTNGTVSWSTRIVGNIALTKTGANKFTLAGSHEYTGDTTVTQGILSQSAPNTFNDSSTVSIASGAFLDLNFDETGGAVTDTVDKLFIGGVQQPAGVYKAIDNATDDGTAIAQITGPGTLTVAAGPAAGYTAWAAINAGGEGAQSDFDKDGVSNGVEFFMNAAAGFTANPQLNTSNSITWPNGGNIPASAYGTQFVVQTSPDLTTWTPVLVGDLTTNTNGPGGSLTYTLTGGSPRFVRLSVTPN